MATHRASGRAQIRPLQPVGKGARRDPQAMSANAVKASVLGVLATATIAAPIASAATSSDETSAAPGEAVTVIPAAAPAEPAQDQAIAPVEVTENSEDTDTGQYSETVAADFVAEGPGADVTSAGNQIAPTQDSSAAIAAPSSPGGYISPGLGSPVTSNFGWRTHPVLGYSKLHNGVDYGLSCGAPAVAAKSGVVTDSSFNGTSGNRVVVDHGDGTSTEYFHLQSRGVAAGETVQQGEEVGKVGNTGRSTGCHLHFGAVKNSTGEYFDPLSLFQ